jgi:hypothetical protein
MTYIFLQCMYLELKHKTLIQTLNRRRHFYKAKVIFEPALNQNDTDRDENVNPLLCVRTPLIILNTLICTWD